MEKEITHAVFFIKNIDNELNLFMGHSTGNKFFDVPKGGGEENETAIQSAIREVQEETGFNITPEELVDIGVFKYNRKKNMHVFIYIGKQDIKPENAFCESTFTCHHTGKERPELDGYKYVPFSEVNNASAKSFKNVFDAVTQINLSAFIG